MEIVETRTQQVHQAQAHMKTQQAYQEQAEDLTLYHEHDGCMQTQVLVRLHCPTGHGSTYRSVYATYAHGTPLPSQES